MASVPDLDAPIPGEPPPARNWAMRLAIAFILLLFVSLVAILYVRSVLSVPHTASALLVVQGHAGIRGATVVISGPPPLVLSDTLTSADNYTCRFSLPAGSYIVRIEHNGRLLYHNPQLNLPEHRYTLLTLPTPP